MASRAGGGAMAHKKNTKGEGRADDGAQSGGMLRKPEVGQCEGHESGIRGWKQGVKSWRGAGAGEMKRGKMVRKWKRYGVKGEIIEANLVNYHNENENEIDDLGYQSKEYIEDAHEDDENNHLNGYVKRGITRLCKFRKEYGKPGGVKLSVTFDALNRI
ncbi:hypothetical protein Tco_0653983 [Tanacetum coccineum]|uniref:Uncharacterized protein n=1 Tax=Tanacetum coccineum TaxID=301880 RepID=A0ABQ4X229_9ASTR